MLQFQPGRVWYLSLDRRSANVAFDFLELPNIDHPSVDNGNGEAASASGAYTNPQLSSGIKTGTEMQQLQPETTVETGANGCVTTPSVSSTSFSSASSSGSSNGPGCSKCGIHRISRLKHSDSGISQSSGEHLHVKPALSKVIGLKIDHHKFSLW